MPLNTSYYTSKKTFLYLSNIGQVPQFSCNNSNNTTTTTTKQKSTLTSPIILKIRLCWVYLPRIHSIRRNTLLHQRLKAVEGEIEVNFCYPVWCLPFNKVVGISALEVMHLVKQFNSYIRPLTPPIQKTVQLIYSLERTSLLLRVKQTFSSHIFFFLRNSLDE